LSFWQTDAELLAIRIAAKMRMPLGRGRFLANVTGDPAKNVVDISSGMQGIGKASNA